MTDSVSASRDRNRATVEYFFTISGTRRLEIYTDDGVKELPFFPASLRSEGMEQLRAHHELIGDVFPDWKWSDLKILGSEDPNIFWATAKGAGSFMLSDGPSLYENSYVFYFEMREGKIALLQEYNNPMQLLKSAGAKLVLANADHGIVSHFDGMLD